MDRLVIVKTTALLRAVWFLISFAFSIGLFYERHNLSPDDLKTVVFSIVSRESLLLIGILTFSGLAVIAAWPVVVYIKNIPKRYSERRKAIRREEQDKTIRLLNGCASIIRSDWAVVRGSHHPAEPYRLAEVLDGFLQRHPTYPDRAGQQKAAHVRLSSYLCQLNAKGLLPEASPDGPCRVWADDLEHLSAVLQTHGMEAAQRSALELQNDSPEAEPHRERKLAIALLEAVREERDKIPINMWSSEELSISENVAVAHTRLREMGLGMPNDRPYGSWYKHTEELLDLLRYQDGVERARTLVAERYPDDVKS